MSKQFQKFIDDEEMYKATCDFILDIDRPQYTEGMSFQDYGALCVAHDKLLAKLSARLDSVWREGEQHKTNVV